eukprot:5258521-Heterocapsa_arctica.AAC.1
MMTEVHPTKYKGRFDDDFQIFPRTSPTRAQIRTQSRAPHRFPEGLRQALLLAKDPWAQGVAGPS